MEKYLKALEVEIDKLLGKEKLQGINMGNENNLHILLENWKCAKEYKHAQESSEMRPSGTATR